VKFNLEGKFIKSFGTKGQGPGEFLSPWQMAIHNDEIYVYDWRRNIQKFTINEFFIKVIDSYPEAKEPGGGVRLDKLHI